MNTLHANHDHSSSYNPNEAPEANSNPKCHTDSNSSNDFTTNANLNLQNKTIEPDKSAVVCKDIGKWHAQSYANVWALVQKLLQAHPNSEGWKQSMPYASTPT
jgi:hypothetical protein